jgi:hypothetical protein
MMFGMGVPLAIKQAANKAVAKAIKDGTLIRQNCEYCDRPGLAHHENYSRPLEVRWLCPLHHHARHLEMGNGRRDFAPKQPDGWGSPTVSKFDQEWYNEEILRLLRK